MIRLSITVEESLRDFVDAETRSGGYKDPSEYVASLLHDAQARKAEQREADERLKEMLREGLTSGKATDMTSADWASIRQEVARRIAARNKE